MKIDDNLELKADGLIACLHCGAEVGPSRLDPLAKAVRYERKSTVEEPGIRADPALFTDRPIVIRQNCCPGCFALLKTEIVPGDEPGYRHWRLDAADVSYE